MHLSWYFQQKPFKVVVRSVKIREAIVFLSVPTIKYYRTNDIAFLMSQATINYKDICLNHKAFSATNTGNRL